MLNLGQIITKLHYAKLKDLRGFRAVFAILLLPPAAFYFAVISFKNLLYRLNILKEKKVTPKVICIGNLTTGGVGKTPVTVEFCRYLSKICKVSSLSRGYGGKIKGAKIVKDFNKILENNPALTGDEVQILAQSADEENLKTGKTYAVTVSKDRIKGADLITKELHADVIVMDDGFSNRKIQKDLTFLLFDTEKLTGNGCLLPLGPLREPLWEIKRADAIILVNKNPAIKSAIAETERIKTAFACILGQKGLEKPVFGAEFGIECFYDILTGEKFDPSKITETFAFSGIGQPEQFYNYLTVSSFEELKNIKLVGARSFNDHHAYTKDDIEKITGTCGELGAKFAVTTTKDEVKIKKILQKTPSFKTSHCGVTFLAMKLCVRIDVEKILSEMNFRV